MNRKSNARKYGLLYLFIFISFSGFAQCELTGDKEVRKEWKKEYYHFFSVDKTTPLIEADSILIFYLSNNDNETTNAMACCYVLAEEYARNELKRNIKLLYKKLEQEDSLNFSKAQRSWQLFYDSEWLFIKTAFVGYINYTKYGQGREIMIHNVSDRYQMIKDRILVIQNYIDLTSMD